MISSSLCVKNSKSVGPTNTGMLIEVMSSTLFMMVFKIANLHPYQSKLCHVVPSFHLCFTAGITYPTKNLSGPTYPITLETPMK